MTPNCIRCVFFTAKGFDCLRKPCVPLYGQCAKGVTKQDDLQAIELDGKSDSAWRERIGNAVPPHAARAVASVMGTTLLLAWAGDTGKSDSAWRERIGNAVPPHAARAVASVMGTTLLLAWAGDTFLLSDTPIWVNPNRLIEVALTIDAVGVYE